MVRQDRVLRPCPCYICKGQVQLSRAVRDDHRAKQRRHLDAIMGQIDVPLYPGNLAEARGVDAEAEIPVASSSDDYVDQNPIHDLPNWDANVTVSSINTHTTGTLRSTTTTTTHRMTQTPARLRRLCTPYWIGQHGTPRGRLPRRGCGTSPKDSSPRTTSSGVSVSLRRS